MVNRLSIILPLKDRAEFTARCITAAKLVRDSQVIVADGSAIAQGWVRNDPCCDYFYSGHDITLSRWWHKMVLAMDRVETPYACILDNDDVPVPSGIYRCLDFLDAHSDYIAASGRVGGFWSWPDQVTGPHFRQSGRYGLYDVPADYNSPSANDRVLAGFQNSWSFYAIYRSEALRTIRQDVMDLNLTNLQVHEKFCAMRALTLGKIKCDGSFISYLRQRGTSASAGKLPPFHERLMQDNLTDNIEKVLKAMAQHDIDTAVLRMRWAAWWGDYLKREYGGWRQLRQAAKTRFPRLAWTVQNRHRWGLA